MRSISIAVRVLLISAGALLLPLDLNGEKLPKSLETDQSDERPPISTPPVGTPPALPIEDSEAPSVGDQPTSRGTMTDEDFDEFLDSAMAELLAKQERLKVEHGLGRFARWHFDQETEKLDFFDESDRKILEADVIDIGSYASSSDTWKWAWSNESVLPSLREKAAPLKDLGAVTGLALFTEEAAMSINGEDMAWELVAMSVKHLNAIGAYKAPSSTRPLATFLAIMRIHRLLPQL